jgi:hypothetical protein
MRVDKQALKAELLAQLTAALAAATAAHASAIEGATHAEARPENDKDTRGLEQSYLARGQAQRVAELTAAVADVTALALRAFGPRDAIAPGAIVTLEDGADTYRRFIAPGGGGNALAGDLAVVTPSHRSAAPCSASAPATTSSSPCPPAPARSRSSRSRSIAASSPAAAGADRLRTGTELE